MTGVDPSGEDEWEATEHETYLSDELVVVSKSFHQSLLGKYGVTIISVGHPTFAEPSDPQRA